MMQQLTDSQFSRTNQIRKFQCEVPSQKLCNWSIRILFASCLQFLDYSAQNNRKWFDRWARTSAIEPRKSISFHLIHESNTCFQHLNLLYMDRMTSRTQSSRARRRPRKRGKEQNKISLFFCISCNRQLRKISSNAGFKIAWHLMFIMVGRRHLLSQIKPKMVK